MDIACLDLEGVLIPEIWAKVAEHTGIDTLRITTRDVQNYDCLMQKRLIKIKQCGLQMSQIREIISNMQPLEGAYEFLSWLRRYCQVIIVSDTFYELVAPLSQQLGWPTIFCHHLEISDDRIISYKLRKANFKKAVVHALHHLNFRVVAVGDAYNDIDMLNEAELGILFRPPKKIALAYPQFMVLENFRDMQTVLSRIVGIPVSCTQ